MHMDKYFILPLSFQTYSTLKSKPNIECNGIRGVRVKHAFVRFSLIITSNNPVEM